MLSAKYFETKVNKLNDLKNKLNNYSAFIHTPYKNTGLTPYYLLGLKESNLMKIEKSNHDLSTIKMSNLSNLNKSDIDKIFSNMSNLINFYSKNIISISNHKFNYIVSQDLNDTEFINVTNSISKLKNSLTELIELNNELNTVFGVEKLDILQNNNIYFDNLELLGNNPQLMGNDIESIKNFVDILNKFQIKTKEYGDPFKGCK